MIPHMVGKLAPNSSHLTRGLVKYVPGRAPVGAIFEPFPPKTGTNLLHPRPSPIVERVLKISFLFLCTVLYILC